MNRLELAWGLPMHPGLPPILHRPLGLWPHAEEGFTPKEGSRLPATQVPIIQGKKFRKI